MEMCAPGPVRREAAGQNVGGPQKLGDQSEEGKQPEETASWKESQGEESDERKGEVEMLFYAQTPGGAEAVHAQIVLQEQQVVGVNDVVVEVKLCKCEQSKRGEIRRQRSKPAGRPESPKGKGAGTFVRVCLGAEINTADEKAGQEEKEIDAHTESFECGDSVREENHRNGEGSEQIEAEVTFGIHRSPNFSARGCGWLSDGWRIVGLVLRMR